MTTHKTITTKKEMKNLRQMAMLGLSVVNKRGLYLPHKLIMDYIKYLEKAK